MNEIQLSTVKTITRFVVSHSISAVTVMALNNVASPSTKKQKLQLAIGAYVVGSMIADKSDDWVDNRIDEIASTVQKLQAFFRGEPTQEEPQTLVTE